MIQVPDVKLQFMDQAYYETFIGFVFFYQSKNYVTVTRKMIKLKKKKNEIAFLSALLSGDVCRPLSITCTLPGEWFIWCVAPCRVNLDYNDRDNRIWFVLNNLWI